MLMPVKRLRSILTVWLLFLSTTIVLGQLHHQLQWDELPPLPDDEGFAGMFAGVSHDALICMGGANFPEAMPWEGGKKVWYDNIYVLPERATGWTLAKEKLPRPLGYGVYATYNNRIIIAGGSDATRHYADVFSIEYVNGNILIDTLPSLPTPLANMTGAVAGGYLYIAGGQSAADAMPQKNFLALDLRKPRREMKWETLAPWPGRSRMMAVSATVGDEFYLFSGIDLEQTAEGKSERVILTDAYKYTPATGEWNRLADMPRGAAAGPNPAPTMGSSHILFPGGVDATTAQHKDPKTFPGFVEDLPAYHVQSDKWTDFGKLPENTTRVTVPAVNWNGTWAIVNGEQGPGKRSPKVFALSRAQSFGWLNWGALILYLALMLLIGFYFNKKDQTTSNFYTANGKIPWWAAGLSIYGTQLSAITFMAIPALVYATDWSLALGPVMILAIVPFVVKYYIPFFRNLSITSAYEYLEYRFSATIRILGCISFILFQLGRIGIVLFLPAIAISSVTGIDVYLLISIMGVICVIYTVMGGIEAVIWADVIQVVILLGGAILCLVVAIANVEGGLLGTISIGLEDGKFHLIHWGWGQDKLYLWILVVGFFFLNIIPYTSDQTIVQRYVTVKDEKATAKSLYTNGVITLPGIVIFFSLGTVLYVFYKENINVIPSESVGEVLPYFVVNQIPAGLAGLIIAGVFAASQSTLSSSMNSISAAYVTDLHQRMFPAMSEKQKLRTARSATMIAGVLGVASAMITAALNVKFIFDFFQEVLGIFGGSLAGVFMLGIFFHRANAPGALIGFLTSVVCVWLVKHYTGINVYLYAAISVVTCIVVGYGTSLFFPSQKDIDGLTYATLHKRKESASEKVNS